MERNFPETPCGWLMRHATYRPRMPYLIDQGNVCVHQDFQNFVVALTHHLNHLGVSPGDVIAACCRSRYLLASLIFAAPILGCVVQTFSPDLPWHVITALLTNTRARYLIADSLNKLNDIVTINAATLYENLYSADTQGEPAAANLAPEAVQLIVATSGSEGSPKGVMLTGRNINAAVTASRAQIKLEPTDRWLLCLPLYHIGGLAILHRCAQAGAAAVLADSSKGPALAKTLVQQACTHVSLVPAMLARLLKAMTTPPPSLRYVLIGGAALDPTLAQQALAQGWPLCISYGMSETCSQLATLHSPAPNWPGGLVGRPIAGMQARINKQSGRIQVCGAALMTGYTNPELTSGIGIMEDGWFETADLGYLDAVGQLWVQGRADQVLISGGLKIHPLQVEELLESNCPNITEVAVSGRPDPIWGEILVAIFVGTATPKQVNAWCQEQVPGSIRPRAFIKVSTLPRTSLGKIDRATLRSIAALENGI